AAQRAQRGSDYRAKDIVRHGARDRVVVVSRLITGDIRVGTRVLLKQSTDLIEQSHPFLLLVRHASCCRRCGTDMKMLAATTGAAPMAAPIACPRTRCEVA